MSDSDPTTHLSELERERVALYADLAEGRRGWWLFPALGAWLAVLAATYDLEQPWRIIGNLGVGLGLGLVFLLACQRLIAHAGVEPRVSELPWPLARINLAIWAGSVLVAIVAAGLALLSEHAYRFTIAGIVGGTVVAVGGTLSLFYYRAVARRLAREAGVRS